MPKIFESKGYKFFFFSNEGDPLERVHVYVRKGKSIAKYWISPDVTLSSSWGMSSQELHMLEDIIIKHKTQITETWNEYFNR